MHCTHENIQMSVMIRNHKHICCCCTFDFLTDHRMVFYWLVSLFFPLFCQKYAVICKSGISTALVWLICTLFLSFFIPSVTDHLPQYESTAVSCASFYQMQKIFRIMRNTTKIREKKIHTSRILLVFSDYSQLPERIKYKYACVWLWLMRSHLFDCTILIWYRFPEDIPFHMSKFDWLNSTQHINTHTPGRQ